MTDASDAARSRADYEAGNPLFRRPAPELTPAARDVLAERQRQQEVEGYTPEHDDMHNGGELRIAAACYLVHATLPSRRRIELAVSGSIPDMWPFDDKWWKPTTVRQDILKALALGLAEIERLDRANNTAIPKPLAIYHSAATLADLWAKVSAECATQEQHGLTVVSVSAEIVFKEETR